VDVPDDLVQLAREVLAAELEALRVWAGALEHRQGVGAGYCL
jgi:hypothetical protein